MKAEPQPCKRFKHMNYTPAFVKHLPKCPKCQAVIPYLERDLEMLLWRTDTETELLETA